MDTGVFGASGAGGDGGVRYLPQSGKKVEAGETVAGKRFIYDELTFSYLAYYDEAIPKETNLPLHHPYDD